MTDKTTKALLLAIAIGLWANVASQWLRPVTAHAQSETTLRNITLGNIENDLHRIYKGTCLNSKIC